jgi:hypothetical protein
MMKNLLQLLRILFGATVGRQRPAVALVYAALPDLGLDFLVLRFVSADGGDRRRGCAADEAEAQP